MSNTFALIPVFQQKFTDNDFSALVGGKLYSYEAGTSTPLATYTDSTGNTPNTNPVILDSTAAANIWMGAGAYKFVLEDADGNVLKTEDGVVMPGSAISILLPNQVTGVLDIAHGGTGASTQGAAMTALAGTQSSGEYLRSDGTNTALSAIQVADVPTLNQNTTGTAANITATSNSTLTTLSALSLPASQITSQLPVANGGTGQSTANSGLNALLPSQTGNSGKVLSTNGLNSSWISSSASPTAPTITRLTATGSQTGYLFTISTSTTCAIGDTYTNNGATYTVLATLAAQSGQVLWMSGTGTLSGTTLTRASGSGTASITFTLATALATYTAPTGPAPLYLEVEMPGGGGGGGGGNTTAGSVGTASFFGINLLIASPGGGGGITNAAPAVGGGFTVNSPALDMGSVNGGDGTSGFDLSGGFPNAGPGGSSFFGGNGGGSVNNGSGTAGKAGTGSGGGGGCTGNNFGGGGGAAGGTVRAQIKTPSTTYFYAIGGGGTGGSTGASGGSSHANIKEYYQ